MARKVFMIAPFEALTGNLSGDQDLQYAENNNPAYEAPNGTQYARNYKTRYVGARRGKDGLVYFQVKQSTATVLTASSRRTMAVVGVTAAIRSALVRNQPTLWGTINDAFAYLKAGGRLPEGQDTFNKWFSANIRQMLVYKRATWSFSYVPLAFTIHNPYDLSSSEALRIKDSTWIKFANWFAFSNVAINMAYITIDGMKLFCAGDSADSLSFANVKNFSSNPSYVSNLADLVIGADDVTYESLQVYTREGTAVTPGTVMTDGEKFTTAAPES